MQVDFYHVGAGGVEAVLPRIAERVLDGGGRLLVVAEDEALAARLDERLWDWSPESFLAHGRAGQGDEARQPILIAEACEPANGARAVALADGVWRDAALAFDRAFLLFGDDRLEASRAAWRTLAAQDSVERRFWKQDERGRWTQAG
ncbi:DNA polymerase III subunit chi [Sphingomonas jatrophae]|uniref:DNA polymerase III, chi subunit n=1 Tax=Sphingomonas jatrophae TaxID=1166337 RepID=A0A1I6L5A9_9SPHN|nr:DNA polymerase III subunit chi [Sphingomonas jatrophae]SFR98622.1 DNA polymerase III, chi subunit [Sphingomonas jatrophae]